MKFLASIAFVALALSEAESFERKLGGQPVNMQQVLRNAVRVDRSGRQLGGGGNNNNNNALQATAYQSLQFDSCVSLTTESQDNDVLFGDLIDYTKAGQIVSVTNYVLFNVCDTGNCTYKSDQNLYMVDLATYMKALLEFWPTKDEAYCTTCANAMEWCMYNRYNSASGSSSSSSSNNANNGGRELANNNNNNANNGNIIVVGCDSCAQRGCFDRAQNNNNGNNNNANGQNDNSGGQSTNDLLTPYQISQWADNYLGCKDLGVQWNNQELYASFMCNGDGSGIELAIFLDNNCQVYTSLQSFQSLVSESDAPYYYGSAEVVTWPFLHDIDCGSLPNYITPEEAYQMQQNGNNNNNNQNNNNNGQSNAYCQTVFQDADVRPVHDCNYDGKYDQNDGNVEVDEESGYSWYSYVLSQQNSQNPEAVCEIIQKLDGQFKYVYNSKSSASGSYYTNYSNQFKNQNQHRGAKIFGIILLVLVALGGAAFAAKKFIIAPRDSKRDNLLNGGAMS